MLGGRAGVGKTSVANEMSALLRAADLAHCHIEGDVLDAAYPNRTTTRTARASLSATSVT